MIAALRSLLATLAIPLVCLLASPALAAFTDNGDGTVTDNVTGLMWDKCSWGQSGNDCSGGAASTLTWLQALVATTTANTGNYKNRNDWRLPNFNELQSLTKIDAGSPAIDTAYFPRTPSSWFWSSTTRVSGLLDSAWVVNFYVYGDMGAVNKTLNGLVRLVRRGQSFGSFDSLAVPVAAHRLTVTASGTGSGTVVSGETPAHFNCTSAAGVTSGNCQSDETEGDTVTLTTTPAPGSIFTGWSGACTNSTGTCTVTLDAAKSVTAAFAASASGTFDVAATNNAGVPFTVPAGAANCYFNATGSWNYGNGVSTDAAGNTGIYDGFTFLLESAPKFSLIASTGGIYQYIGISKNLSVQPGSVMYFQINEGILPGSYTDNSGSISVSWQCVAQSQSFGLAITGSGTGTGTITSGETPSHINCTSTAGTTGSTGCSSDETANATLTLTATPVAGSTFTGWSGACTNATGTCTVTMDAAKSVGAGFDAVSAAGLPKIVGTANTGPNQVRISFAYDNFQPTTYELQCQPTSNSFTALTLTKGGTISAGTFLANPTSQWQVYFNEMATELDYSCAVRFQMPGSLTWSQWSDPVMVRISDPVIDTDGDGLADAWETACGVGGLDLHEVGCPDVNKKDIYLWIDSVAPPHKVGSGGGFKHVYSALSTNEVEMVKKAFSLHGINLHVKHNLVGSKRFAESGLSRSVPEFEIKEGLLAYKKAFGFYDTATNFIEPTLREHVYHYALFGDVLCRDGEASPCVHEANKNYHTGYAPAENNAMFLSGGLFDFEMERAGTLMHEFGHLLGLGHGGPWYSFFTNGNPNMSAPMNEEADSTNHKPNYLSIMNYLFQSSGLIVDKAELRLDYSVKAYRNIDESTQGFSGSNTVMASSEFGPILPGSVNSATYGTKVPCGYIRIGDNFAPDKTKYQIIENIDAYKPTQKSYDWSVCGNLAGNDSYDINADGVGQQVLHGFTDWDRLVFTLGSIGKGFGQVAGGEAFDFSALYAAEKSVKEATIEELRSPQNYLASLRAYLSEKEVSAGAVVRHQFELINTGLSADTYDLTIMSETGWNSVASISLVVALAPGVSKTFYVTTSVPAGATTGTSAQVSVIATGRGYGNGGSADVLMTVTTNLPVDTDGDGIPDVSDPNPTSADADGDGFLDTNDPHPNQADSTIVNTFSFTPVTNAALSTQIDSTAIVVSGPTVSVPIGVLNGQYAIDGGAFTSLSGTVNTGQSVVVRVLSDWTNSTTTSALMNIGGQIAPFAVTTSILGQVTAPSATSTGNISVVFSGGGSGCGLGMARFIAANSPPAGVAFPHGLFDFTLHNCVGTVTLTLTYPQPLPAGSQYWKYGPTSSDTTPHWYVLPASFSGNQVVFALTDGGLGDDDLAVNGLIVDQGGPGSGAVSIPTLSEWGMVMISLLLAGMALLTLRRQRSEGLGH